MQRGHCELAAHHPSERAPRGHGADTGILRSRSEPQTPLHEVQGRAAWRGLLAVGCGIPVLAGQLSVMAGSVER